MGKAVRFLILALSLTVAVSAEAQAPRRVALIIGNANYTGYPSLPNTLVDVGLVAGALRQAGFDITQRSDLDGEGMRTALAQFRATATGAQVALVYFAGHGMASGGRNWMLPTGARLSTLEDLEFAAVEDTLLVQATAGAQARVIVLDACRNNPLAVRIRGVTRDVSVGLAAPREAVRGTLFMYSAAPGQVAQDGPPGAGSPFARAFARHIVTPGLDLRRAAGEVSESVYRETGSNQTPFQTSSLSGEEIVFVPAPRILLEPVTSIAPNVQISALAAESAAFDVATKLWTADGWDAFLRVHPNGQNAALSRAALASLRRTDAAPVAPRSSPTASARRALAAITEQEWRAAPEPTLVARIVSASDRRSLESLAAEGDARAQFIIGRAYFGGLSGFPQDHAQAVLYFQPSAAQGNANSQANLGRMNADSQGGLVRGDNSEAVRLYQLAASQGNADGQLMVGYSYETGEGGLTRSMTEAGRYYRLAADQGNSTAQANLASLYWAGDGGVEVNKREALRLYRLSAAQGSAYGQAGLGVMYQNGEGGLTRDLAEAVRLYRLAARQGVPYAQENLRNLGETW